LGGLHPRLGYCLEAIIFIGIQASGKSTFYRERFFNTHIRINLDMLKTRHREDLLLDACLRMKQPFVVDNTNPTIQARAKYIERAKAARFSVVGYFFQTSMKGAIERNSLRDERMRVPANAIGATSARLQIPTLQEGFDALYRVQIDPLGGFHVEQWVDDVMEC